MMTKQSQSALGLAACLTALVLGLAVTSCSLDKTGLGRPTFTKSTFVRANDRGSALKFRARKQQARSWRSNGGTSTQSAPRTSPVVRVPKRKDFFRYAVAYGRPYAVVSDDSVIPFALASSKKAELPRFELPFLKNRKPIVNVLLKASEAPERKARLVTTSPRPTARPKKG